MAAPKSTKNPAAAIPVPASAASTPATTGTAKVVKSEGLNDVFKRVLLDGKGVAPMKDGKPVTTKQVIVLLNTIEAAGEDGATRAQLGVNLEPVLTTRQGTLRILKYYQKLMTDIGCITVTKVAASAPVAAAAPAAA